MSVIKNKQQNSRNQNRGLRNFELMENRQLFAADLLGAAEMVSEVPTDNMAEMRTTEQMGERELVLEEVSQSIFENVGKPAPDDDGPAGPIGPVYKGVLELEPVAGQATDSNHTDWIPVLALDHGVHEGKPDDGVDCDGNRLTAACDLQAPQEEQEGKPDPGPDCDGNPLTAACDIQAPQDEQEGKPEPEPDCDGNRLTAACDLQAPQLEQEGKPEPDCDGNPLTAACDIQAPQDEQEGKPDDFDPDCPHPLMASCDYQAEQEPEANQHPGDANGDHWTDFKDFLILSNNFGKEGTLENGDFNGDNMVDFEDLLILNENFGTANIRALDSVMEMHIWN